MNQDQTQEQATDEIPANLLVLAEVMYGAYYKESDLKVVPFSELTPTHLDRWLRTAEAAATFVIGKVFEDEEEVLEATLSENAVDEANVVPGCDNNCPGCSCK
jgi:hypothetical protein